MKVSIEIIPDEIEILEAARNALAGIRERSELSGSPLTVHIVCIEALVVRVLEAFEKTMQ